MEQIMIDCVRMLDSGPLSNEMLDSERLHPSHPLLYLLS